MLIISSHFIITFPYIKVNTDKASKAYSVGVFRPISLDLIFTYGDDAKLHGITEDGVREWTN